MITLTDLYEMKAEFAHEKSIIEAEIMVVDKLIAKEEAKQVEEIVENVEPVEQPMLDEQM